MTPPPGRTVSGHYTGAATRASAAALDAIVVTSLFTVGYAGLNLLLEAFFSESLSGDRSAPLAVTALALWGFLYMFVSLAIAGRTVGKGIIGIRVVTKAGGTPSVRTVFVRTLMFPVSAALLGLGFLPILFQREHRALHDLIAGTAVVYDWGDRPAMMPGPLSDFLNRQAGTPESDVTRFPG